MLSTLFSVGQSRQCNLWLNDPSISTVLCKLRHIERGGASVVLLEITGGKGAVHVNGKLYQKNESLVLNGGDEVVFTTSGKHAYIFQKLTNNNLGTPDMPSVSILEAQSAPIKGIHIEARPRDPSDYAGASILASLSCLLPPAAKTDVEMKDGTNNHDPCGCFPKGESCCSF
ncbi:hypothetical protein OIU77_010758 [Salix suchowensis]|uniref:FHA domain-containing protein n=1 Tax=Salix suchowensis TaxID=1278906 RepID=A0ABQ9A9M2_9ROSI|nr:hypothetical protein OIU77_010758 [Salix suchowensis]